MSSYENNSYKFKTTYSSIDESLTIIVSDEKTCEEYKFFANNDDKSLISIDNSVVADDLKIGDLYDFLNKKYYEYWDGPRYPTKTHGDDLVIKLKNEAICKQHSGNIKLYLKKQPFDDAKIMVKRHCEIMEKIKEIDDNIGQFALIAFFICLFMIILLCITLFGFEQIIDHGMCPIE